ncbi:1-acyl-sn-glycerol-3-phosphate acyltransferase epsilon-like isoform X1 [Cloeon dipterum]|uniref:1-acyl-sn-glycerol-3-phosphate acyltransferase epsilon-like isoform X1 n=2 Tax=Cloeon dipterum TaxID=197152 RepID=UPI00322097EE
MDPPRTSTSMKIFRYVRYVISTVIMLGAAPEFLLMWGIWKGLSIVLPAWIYQIGDDICYGTYQKLVLFFFNHCNGVKVYFYGDAQEAFKNKETVLYLGNHQSTVDWILTNMVAVEQGSIGHLRFVMKHELQTIPLYGFYFHQHGCIYVKRGHFQPAKMLQSLRYLRNPKIPSWVVIFPEGTRYNPDDGKRITKSREVARDNSLEVLDYHLTPRSRGAWLVLNTMRERLEAIYDITVGYSGNECGKGSFDTDRNKVPQLKDFLLGRCNSVHIHVNRIPISSVPADEEKFQQWVHQMFIKKDKLMKQFYNSSEQEGSEALSWPNKQMQQVGIWHTLPSFLFFSAVSVAMLFTKIGRSIYLNTLVYGTLGGYIWLFISSVC